MTKSFDESKHPRDKDGKFTNGVGTKAEQDKLKSLGIDMQQEKKETSNLSAEEKRLQELTGKMVDRKVSYSNKVIKKVTSLQPVTLEIHGKEIIAEFDTGTCKKNMHNACNSSPAGFRYKKKNIDKWREIIEKGVFFRDAPEEGKNGERHKGVEHWFYLKAKHQDGKNIFSVLINVRKQKNKYFIDELSFRKIYDTKK